MSEEYRSGLDFSKWQNLTAEACSVSKWTASRVCWEAKKGQEEDTWKCLPPRKHINIPKTVTNLDDFQKDKRRIVFEYYDKDEFPTVKKATLTLNGKNCV